MRTLFACAFLLASLALCGAQDWAKSKVDASPRHQEWASIKSGNRTLKAFVVYPEVRTKAPVVLIIHEIMGMSDWVELVADELAAAGYIAIAPDLLSEMGPGRGRTDSFGDIGKVREAISGLPQDQVTGDLNAAANYGLHLPACNGKLMVAGFCWGGSQSFNFATNRPDLTAAFVFYGTAPTDPAAIAKIKCPVYGFYGGNDSRVNATLPDTTKLMTDAKKIFDPVTFDGAGHGFMRAGQDPAGSAQNHLAQQQGWTRFLTLLKRYSK